MSVKSGRILRKYRGLRSRSLSLAHRLKYSGALHYLRSRSLRLRRDGVAVQLRRGAGSLEFRKRRFALQYIAIPSLVGAPLALLRNRRKCAFAKGVARSSGTSRNCTCILSDARAVARRFRERRFRERRIRERRFRESAFPKTFYVY